MALELPRDVDVRRADEMKHLDDLFRARHGAAGCKADSRAHGDDHQQEQRDRKDHDHVRHGVESGDPETVIVDARVGGGGLEG